MATVPMNSRVDLVGCRDECGLQATVDQAEHQGWMLLDIQGRWRCPGCSLALARANSAPANSPQPQPQP